MWRTYYAGENGDYHSNYLAADGDSLDVMKYTGGYGEYASTSEDGGF